MKLSSIKKNPDNPQTIKDVDFKKLVKSIKEFPKMMELRPLIIDDNNIIIGGNKRYDALIHLGYDEVPNNWIKKASKLTKDEIQRFIIADNVNFGEWDYEKLKNQFDKDHLNYWGIDLPDYDRKELEMSTYQLKPYKKTHILISFNPDDFNKISSIIDELYKFDFLEIEQSSN